MKHTKRILTLVTVAALLVSMAGCSIIDRMIGSTDIEVPGISGRPSWVGGDGAMSSDWDTLDLKVIDSIDKLNYYSAVYVLREKATLGLSVRPLADYDSDDSHGQEQGSEGNAEPDGVIEDTPSSPGIVTYALSPDDAFTFEKVSMFTVELTDPDGFLASILGLGTVEVVITEDCIWGEALITFRNGDKFYSCLSNGASYYKDNGEMHWDFSTHKFISGFYIVKNIEQENYSFNIKFNSEGQAYSFVSAPFKNGGSHADLDVQITSTTERRSYDAAFTVAELDAYFSQQIPTPDTQPDSNAPSDTDTPMDGDKPIDSDKTSDTGTSIGTDDPTDTDAERA